MKRFFVLLVMAVLSLGSLNAAELKWITDFKAAQKQAATENKTLLLNFTGSDWCGWCIRLDKEVFSKPEFAEYAEKNLVLVKLDFPRKKTQSEAEKTQNKALAEKYGVEGFPTIVILDSKSKKLGDLGYEEGGAVNWIKSVEKITKKK